MDTPHPAPSVDLSSGFRLGDWTVEPLSNTLHRAEHAIHIEPKVMDVLLCLARHQGTVVSRDQLLSDVWKSLVVTEEVLTRCVSELRTALGDTSRERRYIRTIPKRGYSLMMPIRIVGTQQQTRTGLQASAPNHTPGTRHVNQLHIDERHASQLHTNEPHTGAVHAGSGHTGGPHTNQLHAGEPHIDSNIKKTATVRFWQLTRGLLLALGGFVVVGVVVVALFGKTATQDNTSITPAVIAPTVAVLPFVNLSGDPELEYFGNGLAEDIRNQLINTVGIQVAARTSSEVFRNQAIDVREIGSKLNVAALVEGTVRLNGKRLRLTVQLTDATSGYPMWSELYEQAYDEVFSIQNQVALKVLEHLAPALNPTTLTQSRMIPTDVRAYDYYLLGRHHWNQRDKESVKKSIDYFQRALEIDDNYALAYSGLADALMLQNLLPEGAIVEQAQQYVDKAMAINANSAEIHASQGLIYLNSFRYEQARASYQSALVINPNYSMAHMWLGNVASELGNTKAAFEHYKSALAVDPLHSAVQQNYLYALQLMGLYDQVEQQAKQFYAQTHAEGLLKIQMYSYLVSGQYKKVLDFAVGHNFSERYAHYATQILMQALINLGRFSDVESLIEQNPGRFNADQLGSFRAQQFLAAREPDKVLIVTEQMQRSSDPCHVSLAHQYAGQAHVLQQHYERANRNFEKSLQEINSNCWRDAAQQLKVHANYTRSTRMAGDPDKADNMLALAFKKLNQLIAGGRGGADLLFSQASLEVARGDLQKAGEILQVMDDKGWQPYARVRDDPLFDGLQEQLFAGQRGLQQVAGGYRTMQAQCEQVGLTKFGL